MRKIAATGVAAAALAILAGCGGSDDPPAPTTISVTLPSETTSSATTTPDLTTTIPDTTITDDTVATGGGAQAPQPGSGEGASSAIEAAEAVLTSAGTPQQACGTYVTEKFIATSYGGEANCIAAREGQPLAAAIGVQSGDESSTHLVVIPSGGPYGAARVAVDLVEQYGRFRVDALDAHVPAGP